MIDEKNIVKLLNLADENTFETVFKEFFPGLCQYAYQIVKSQAIAEEIVEDLFLYLWENAGNNNINTSLRPYLYKSVYNRCLKYLRHIKVEQKYAEKTNYILKDEELYATYSQDYPLANIIAKELDIEIKKAISNLPDQCREIFLLQRENELTYTEVAEKLNISINTVKTQMTRALCKIRDSLKDYL
jgi:RNA polymerase sigma-70 factor (ECF subfamily)